MQPEYVQRRFEAFKRALLSAVGIVGLGSTPALADDIEWGNINGGLFSVNANWIGGIRPGVGDTAHFARTRMPDEQVVYTVSFNSSPSNVSMVVERDRVTFDLNGNVYLLTGSLFAMTVGTTASGSGVLLLTDGVVATAVPNSRVTIGGSPNATGLLSLTTGAQLLGASVRVGYVGRGTLVVQNGADLVGGPMFIGSDASGGITGTATVVGVGSAMIVEELSVGWFGAGTLNINNAGRVESTAGTLGRNSGVLGTVNVDGAGSRWTTSDIIAVGYTGPGAMNITNGARVQCPRASAGFLQGSSGMISITGAAELIAQGNVGVGNQGTGTMSVTGAGVVQSDSASIGVIAPGTVTIDGVGSRWICSSDVTVGAGTGNGTLNITNGGEVRSADGFLGRYSGVGSVSVSGERSLWTITQDLSVGGDIDTGFNGGAGALTIGAGGTLTAARIAIYPHGSVQLNGGTLDASSIVPAFGPGGQFTVLSGVLHAGVVGFSLLNAGATLAPGHSPGRTTIIGSYTQLTAATMEIEIGGTTPGTQFDQIFVETVGALGGTLTLRLLNGFVPSPGQTFVVLDAGNIVGIFANVANGQRLAITGGGGSFIVNYGAGSPFDPSQVVLSGFSACTADFNADNFVNSQDLFDFLTAFFALNPRADINADGFINSQDLFDFLAAFFNGC